jgi:ferrochelatase
MLVMSFHGVPRFTVDKGDPYHLQCQETARRVGDALGLAPDAYRISFQSRFGRAEWLKPYTVEVLAELARTGTREVDVLCPGFVADCLETLEEIAMEGKATFLSAGGREFRYIPALNERHDWIVALTDLVVRELGDWLGTAAGPAAGAHADETLRFRSQNPGFRN